MIPRLEASVVQSICTQLSNLGWVVDETKPENNVTQERPKTVEQQKALRALRPDFVLYRTGTTEPIGIIEAKKPGTPLSAALEQADRYAEAIEAPLIFAYNGSFVDTRHRIPARGLKIDGEDVRQFVNHPTSLRFVREGPEILSGFPDVQMSREQLIKIFKRQANLLREAGLQAGLERFGAFSDVLFLKLMDEVCRLREHSGEEPPLLPHLRWSDFEDRDPDDRLHYVKDTVWPAMKTRFGAVFSDEFPIRKPSIFEKMVRDLSAYNFTGTDVDVKGDAFEYFLKNAYQAVGIKDLGEYFTPRNIVRTMVAMVDPRFGERVYDPFCGTGGFLIETFRYIALRVKADARIERQLKNETIHGAELTATARVARMNMILFGDGHSNVAQHDSFEHRVEERYDVILTNPPYSQTTQYGNQYKVPTQNGDAIAVQHCLDALKPGGRAAILVKDDFLTKKGPIRAVRNLLLASVKNLNVVSLPRGLFQPYTPTKTSILYFEKQAGRDSVRFFLVNHVGHTFGARRRSILENDLPQALESVRSPSPVEFSCEGMEVELSSILGAGGSFWPYDYAEVLPGSAEDLLPLRDFIKKSGQPFRPDAHPEQCFRVLGVNNHIGVFLNDVVRGSDLHQRYIKVQEGDLVYNPHRVNVGSIGVVSAELAGGIVSGIYVVFRPSHPTLPSSYFLRLLKSEPYLRIIRAYDTQGAVRANLSWDQLRRIKFVLPSPEERKAFLAQAYKARRLHEEAADLEDGLPALMPGLAAPAIFSVGIPRPVRDSAYVGVIDPAPIPPRPRPKAPTGQES